MSILTMAFDSPFIWIEDRRPTSGYSLLLLCQILCPQLFPFLQAFRSIKLFLCRYRFQLKRFRIACNHTNTASNALFAIVFREMEPACLDKRGDPAYEQVFWKSDLRVSRWHRLHQCLPAWLYRQDTRRLWSGNLQKIPLPA